MAKEQEYAVKFCIYPYDVSRDIIDKDCKAEWSYISDQIFTPEFEYELKNTSVDDPYQLEKLAEKYFLGEWEYSDRLSNDNEDVIVQTVDRYGIRAPWGDDGKLAQPYCVIFTKEDK